MQQPIDSEGNEMYHDFVVVGGTGEAEKARVLKPVMQWWMTRMYRDRHDGDLPEDMAKENAYWERFETIDDTTL